MKKEIDKIQPSIPLLNIQNLTKKVQHKNNNLTILNQVCFQINLNEIAIITGPSGAGKSSLLHILGLVDNQFECEKYFLNSIDIQKQPLKKKEKLRQSQIGFVFQQFHLFPEWTVFDNIALSLIFSQPYINQQEIKDKIHEIAEKTHLDHRINYEVYRLSGGEQQRVSIARALVKKPQIILCDEPTGNLDKKTGHNILNLLKKYIDTNKASLIIVTHDPNSIQFQHKHFQIEAGKLTKLF